MKMHDHEDEDESGSRVVLFDNRADTSLGPDDRFVQKTARAVATEVYLRGFPVQPAIPDRLLALALRIR